MKKNDFIIVGAVLLVALFLFIGIYFFSNGNGKYVQVEIDGEIVDTFDINENIQKEYNFEGNNNTLEIKDGKAYMISANCPDQICVSHKEISKSGETIICLPHKVVVTVMSDNQSSDDIDIEIK